MPYFYDMEEIEWPEDGEDLPPPKPEQFEYISPKDYSGTIEPVHFSYTPYQSVKEPKLTLRQRLFGAPKEQQQQQHFECLCRITEAANQKLLGIMIPAIRELGVIRLYCGYDGGNDEGFAWLQSAELHSGERLNREAMLERLSQLAIAEKLREAGFIKEGAVQKQLVDILRYWLCDEWATILLGRGFGTGNYLMYGAFIVDLENCTIIDDPKADPVTENIILGGKND